MEPVKNTREKLLQNSVGKQQKHSLPAHRETDLLNDVVSTKHNEAEQEQQNTQIKEMQSQCNLYLIPVYSNKIQRDAPTIKG